jgi:acetyl-CoA synthetase
MWYREVIGGNRCPIVDTWWQTETGGIMISPLPGVTATKPGSAMTAIPGISAVVVDDNANPVAKGHGGFLILDKPWPECCVVFGEKIALQRGHIGHDSKGFTLQEMVQS